MLNDDNLHNTFVTNGIHGRILFENDIQNRNFIEKEAGKAVDLLVEHRVLLLLLLLVENGRLKFRNLDSRKCDRDTGMGELAE